MRNANVERPGRRKKQRAAKRNAGRAFFALAFVILVFSLLYSYAGIFPGRSGLLPAPDEIFVSFIDVGQGDAILIRSAKNAVLIDGGEYRMRHDVLEYLRRAGVARLCFVVATHPHSDHIGSLATIVSHVEVGYVAMPDIMHASQAFENLLEAILNHGIETVFPSAGDVLQAGAIRLEVVSPAEASDSGGANNMSVMLRLAHGGTSFLFAGDAERRAEEILLSSGRDISADVLKVGHHGSRTSTSQPFLDAVSPSFAVLTVGARNSFGHPHGDVVARLAQSGAAILRTDELGSIMFVTDGKELTVHVDY